MIAFGNAIRHDTLCGEIESKGAHHEHNIENSDDHCIMSVMLFPHQPGKHHLEAKYKSQPC